MTKQTYFTYLLFLACFAAAAQPAKRTALSTLEQAKVVEGTKAGQVPLSNVNGDLRYAQFPEIEPSAIGFTPATTGNTSNYSEFVTAPDGNLYYIDWQGRGLLLTIAAAADQWNEEYFSSVNTNTITTTGTLPTTNTIKRIVVYRTGVKMREGVDYTVSGNNISLVVGGLAESFTIRYK